MARASARSALRANVARWPARCVFALGSGVRARAHAPTQMTLSSTSAERCLFPPLDERGKPEYPAEALRDKQGGRLDVEFTFTGPDAAPDVRFRSDRVPIVSCSSQGLCGAVARALHGQG